MKKIAIAVIASLVAALSVGTAAEAKGGHKWRHHGGHHAAKHHGHRYHGHRHGWRRHGHHHYHGHRHAHRRAGWWGPRVVIGPAYFGGYEGPYPAATCFVKKVHSLDANGNVYVRRIRICD